MARVLVIAAHPDDEILGCGGTMALLSRQGHEVFVLIAAGRSADESGYGVSQHSFTAAALQEVGVTRWQALGLPDQQLDTLPQKRLITELERAVNEFQPRTVLCQYGGDVNQDHRAIFDAALVATRPTVGCIRSVLAYDTASSTEWAYPRSFVPDTWVDIGPVLDRKLAAMRQYAAELREFPHPRSLVALEHRAIAFGNQCCLPAAEVFMTLRRICTGDEAPL